jgi:hypothetical protein
MVGKWERKERAALYYNGVLGSKIGRGWFASSILLEDFCIGN